VIVTAREWIALGLALANDKFAEQLYLHVGPNAFEGPAWMVYDWIQANEKHKARDYLGLEGGKLSGALLRVLARQAEVAWGLRAAKPNHGRARRLDMEIRRALKNLLALARHDGERFKLVEPPEEFDGGEGI
jgi:hypothetical protein